MYQIFGRRHKVFYWALCNFLFLFCKIFATNPRQIRREKMYKQTEIFSTVYKKCKILGPNFSIPLHNPREYYFLRLFDMNISNLSSSVKIFHENLGANKVNITVQWFLFSDVSVQHIHNLSPKIPQLSIVVSHHSVFYFVKIDVICNSHQLISFIIFRLKVHSKVWTNFWQLKSL